MLKFTQNKLPELKFKKAVKKPIPVKCIQIEEPFKVETMEGVMQGKAGDWLMIGVNNEMYVCDSSIFKKTYELMEK